MPAADRAAPRCCPTPRLWLRETPARLPCPHSVRWVTRRAPSFRESVARRSSRTRAPELLDTRCPTPATPRIICSACRPVSRAAVLEAALLSREANAPIRKADLAGSAPSATGASGCSAGNSSRTTRRPRSVGANSQRHGRGYDVPFDLTPSRHCPAHADGSPIRPRGETQPRGNDRCGLRRERRSSSGWRHEARPVSVTEARLPRKESGCTLWECWSRRPWKREGPNRAPALPASGSRASPTSVVTAADVGSYPGFVL